MSENLTVDLSQSPVEAITSAMSLAITSGQNSDDALEELHHIKDSFDLSDEKFKELFLKALSKDVAGSDAEGASDSIGRRASSLFMPDVLRKNRAEMDALALKMSAYVLKGLKDADPLANIIDALNRQIGPVTVKDADPMTQIIVGALEVYMQDKYEDLLNKVAAKLKADPNSFSTFPAPPHFPMPSHLRTRSFVPIN